LYIINLVTIQIFFLQSQSSSAKPTPTHLAIDNVSKYTKKIGRKFNIQLKKGERAFSNLQKISLPYSKSKLELSPKKVELEYAKKLSFVFISFFFALKAKL